MACIFLNITTSESGPDLVCVLYILTWKRASRHKGVHLFISHLASWLRTRRFSEPTFRTSGATNHWKNTVNREFPTFSRICIFFLLTLSLLLSSLFSLPLPCSANVHWTCTLTWCYATARSLQCIQLRDATLTCTTTWCYVDWVGGVGEGGWVY